MEANLANSTDQSKLRDRFGRRRSYSDSDTNTTQWNRLIRETVIKYLTWDDFESTNQRSVSDWLNNMYGRRESKNPSRNKRRLGQRSCSEDTHTRRQTKVVVLVDDNSDNEGRVVCSRAHGQFMVLWLSGCAAFIKGSLSYLNSNVVSF